MFPPSSSILCLPRNVAFFWPCIELSLWIGGNHASLAQPYTVGCGCSFLHRQNKNDPSRKRITRRTKNPHRTIFNYGLCKRPTHAHARTFESAAVTHIERLHPFLALFSFLLYTHKVGRAEFFFPSVSTISTAFPSLRGNAWRRWDVRQRMSSSQISFTVKSNRLQFNRKLCRSQATFESKCLCGSHCGPPSKCSVAFDDVISR